MPEAPPTVHVLRCAAFVVSLLAFVTSEHASAQGVQASLEGTVTTASGLPIPAVTVTLASHALLPGSVTRLTDSDGRYRFMALPAATYAVTFASPGFHDLTYERVLVPPASVAVFDVSLSAGESREALRIAGVVSPPDRRLLAASTLERESLESIPGIHDGGLILDASPGLLGSSDDIRLDAVPPRVDVWSTGGAEPRRPTLDGVELQALGDWPAFVNDRTLGAVTVVPMGNGAESAVPGPGFAASLKPGGDTGHFSVFVAGQYPRWRWSNVTLEMSAQGVHAGPQVETDHDAGADAGGRIAANRLWFYAAIRRQETGKRIVGYDGVSRVTSTSVTGKLTARPGASHELTAFVQGQSKTQPERDASACRPAASTRYLAARPMAGKIEWAWAPSERARLGAVLTRSDSRTTSNPNTTEVSTYDLATLTYGGAFKTSTEAAPSSDRHNRSQYEVTWSLDRLALPVGTHLLQGAVEVTTEERTRGSTLLGNGQDVMVRFSHGVPDDVLLYNVPVVSTATATTQSAYLRDDWRIGRRATVNLGVRFDRWELFLPAQTKAPGTFGNIPIAGFGPFAYPPVTVRTWSALVPRFTAAYALTSDGKTTVKGSWGRFGEPLDVETGERYNPNALVVAEYEWDDANGNGRYEAAELGAFVRTMGGRTTRATSGDLRQPTTDEITLVFERRIARSLSARAGYAYRRAYDLVQNVNVARPYTAYTIPVVKIDPGPDGTAGTPDDGRGLVVYDFDARYAGPGFEKIVAMNTPGNRATLQTIEATMSRHAGGEWHLLASCTAAHHAEWRNGVPQDPNTASFFPWSEYWQWECKISGGYPLPFGVRVAALFTHTSGDAEARDVRLTGLKQAKSIVLPMQPIGAIRLPHQNLLNLRLEKRQRLGGHGNIAFQADLLNLANSSVPTAVITRSGPSYGRIVAVVPPRSLRLGAEYTF